MLNHVLHFIYIVLLLRYSNGYNLAKSQCSVARNQMTNFVSASCILVCLEDIAQHRQPLYGVNELLIRVVTPDCRRNTTLQQFMGLFPTLKQLRLISPECEFNAPLLPAQLGLETLELFDESGLVLPGITNSDRSHIPQVNQLQELWIRGECCRHMNRFARLPQLHTLRFDCGTELSEQMRHLSIEGSSSKTSDLDARDEYVFLVPQLRNLLVAIKNLKYLTVRNLPILTRLHLVIKECLPNSKRDLLANLPNLQLFEYQSFGPACTLPTNGCWNLNSSKLLDVRLNNFGFLFFCPQIGRSNIAPRLSLNELMEQEKEEIFEEVHPSLRVTCPPDHLENGRRLREYMRATSFQAIEVDLYTCSGIDLLDMLAWFPQALKVVVKLNDPSASFGLETQERMYQIMKKFGIFTIYSVTRLSPETHTSVRNLRQRLAQDPTARLRPEYFSISTAASSHSPNFAVILICLLLMFTFL
ncbi:hypothetical protein Ciccas_007877 [Cichlidogyrus casuarinus]|uniref:Uncharacterized protein n=1 Tax=Cichlidogyrus casuarinus TaxID=1844966 RepID=A0ABD2Q1N9_9PLAT